MKRTITIEGKDYQIECNALLPRQYRKEFGTDLVAGMRTLKAEYDKDPNNVSTEILENLTWLMLKAAGEDVGSTVEEWLSGIEDSFAIYTVMNDVVDLWLNSQKTTSVPKKK
jgi:hypothetical protein